MGSEPTRIAELAKIEIDKQAAKGLAEYGVPLTVNSKNDSLESLIGELVDALKYAIQERERRHDLISRRELEAAVRNLRPLSFDDADTYDSAIGGVLKLIERKGG